MFGKRISSDNKRKQKLHSDTGVHYFNLHSSVAISTQ
jgi:hypothetical protein